MTIDPTTLRKGQKLLVEVTVSDIRPAPELVFIRTPAGGSWACPTALIREVLPMPMEVGQTAWWGFEKVNVIAIDGGFAFVRRSDGSHRMPNLLHLTPCGPGQ